MDYSLQPDETILYERDVTIQGQEKTSRLMLTNLNIVMTEDVNSSLFAKTEETHTVYSVQDIKIYEDLPQVLQKGKHLRILFLFQELNLEFDSFIEANKFRLALFKLVTGKTAPARSAKKVKNAIEIIDDTLGIDTVGTTKAVLETGVVGTLVGGTGKKKTGSKRSRSTRAARQSMPLQLWQAAWCSRRERMNQSSRRYRRKRHFLMTSKLWLLSNSKSCLMRASSLRKSLRRRRERYWGCRGKFFDKQLRNGVILWGFVTERASI